eukprot:g5630.t1
MQATEWREARELLSQIEQELDMHRLKVLELDMPKRPPQYQRPSAALQQQTDLWTLTERERSNLLWWWLQERRAHFRTELEQVVAEWTKVSESLQEIENLQDRQVFAEARVVAMTTTGAATKVKLLRLVQPKIVFVEEAAEILESHMLASLLPSVEQLVLVGDHQQLRLSTAHHLLATQYKLDVSLFQRLVDAGVEKVVLSVQRRMRPVIGKLSKLHYDVPITDDPSVQSYPEVKGVPSPLFLLSHDKAVAKPLQQTRGHVCGTLRERYLQQGYQPSEITILTTYSGQLRLIKVPSMEMNRFLARERFPNDPAWHGDSTSTGGRVVRRVVDKYQGEENRIVLLSLVRSRAQHSKTEQRRNPLGFLNVDNRMCVALSTPRPGPTSVPKCPATWLLNCLKCSVHQQGSEVSRGEDFERVPEGCCSAICAARMPCGHTCPRQCHPDDRQHTETRCMKPCAKVQPFEECQHKCPLRCWEDCGSCTQPVQKLLPDCRHQETMACSTAPAAHSCTTRVSGVFPICGHPDTYVCGQRKLARREGKTLACTRTCDSALPCGDLCTARCHAANPTAHAECKKKCARKLLCEHLCGKRHLCTSMCPPCASAYTPVRSTVHRALSPVCGPASFSSVRANVPNHVIAGHAKICGHPCLCVCGEPCPTHCARCHKHQPVYSDLLLEEELGSFVKANSLARFVTLPCRHSFEVRGLDRCIQAQMNAGSEAQQGIILYFTARMC